jgi:hypothetical protein
MVPSKFRKGIPVNSLYNGNAKHVYSKLQQNYRTPNNPTRNTTRSYNLFRQYKKLQSVQTIQEATICSDNTISYNLFRQYKKLQPVQTIQEATICSDKTTTMKHKLDIN